MDAHQRSPEVQVGKAKPLKRKPRRERLTDASDAKPSLFTDAARRFAPDWEGFLNGIDEAVFALDGSETCHFVNDAFTRLAGITKSALLGKKLGGLLLDEGGKQLRFHATKRLPMRGMMRSNDREIPVEVAAHPIPDCGRKQGCIVQVRQVAGGEDRKRLELIGIMASGVAHDLSNILSPILMGTQILRDAASPEAVAMVVGIIESAAQRGSDILKQVLTCARATSADFSKVDAARLLGEVKDQGAETLRSNIHLAIQAPAGKSVLKGDASQLRLMLLSLLEAEADGLAEGGSLTLHAANAPLDAPENVLPDGAKPGPYIRFHVSHWVPSGEHAPAPRDPRDRIPTTKTGIRLAMVRAIAQNHRGFVLATSSLVGAEVYIPATEPAVNTSERVDGEFSGRGESLLIVDREPGLRRIMNAVLQSAGYNVIAAADFAEVQAQTPDAPKAFALIIADDSAEAREQLRAQRRSNQPSRFILVTKEVGKNELSDTEVEAFLMKPYLPQALLRTVREVLDRPQGQEFAQ